MSDEDPKLFRFAENVEHADEGCEVSARCLDCPLPECRFVTGRSALSAIRDATVARMSAAGTTAPEIAEALDISVRSAHRRLQQWRQLSQNS